MNKQDVCRESLGWRIKALRHAHGGSESRKKRGREIHSREKLRSSKTWGWVGLVARPDAESQKVTQTTTPEVWFMGRTSTTRGPRVWT